MHSQAIEVNGLIFDNLVGYVPTSSMIEHKRLGGPSFERSNLRAASHGCRASVAGRVTEGKQAG